MAIRKLSELDSEELDFSDNVPMRKDAEIKKPDSAAAVDADLSDSENTLRSIPSVVTEIPKEKVWTNKELNVIKPPLTVYIPLHILTMMRSIEAMMGSKYVEFGAFLKGKFENGCLTLSEDFVVVKQKVTGASIDFQENPPDGYNGVIHRHPSGCLKFSGTDDSSINQNQMFSLLYVNNAITYGVINLDLPDKSRLQVELEVKIIYPVVSGIDDIMSKITAEPQQLMIPEQTMGQGLLSFPDGTNDNLGNELEDDEDKPDVTGCRKSDGDYDIGGGFVYDGTYVYDSEYTITDEEDLPPDVQQRLINIKCLLGET